MPSNTIPSALKCLLAAGLIVPLTGCLAQRTTSEGGTTVKQEYVIKRPFKEPKEPKEPSQGSPDK